MTNNQMPRPIDRDRQEILRRATEPAGIAELMTLYEAAEAVYISTVALPPVHVAASTH